MVFTSLFSLEMLLKVLALGLFGYIKNPYNGFDSIIVIIRWAPLSYVLPPKMWIGRILSLPATQLCRFPNLSQRR